MVTLDVFLIILASLFLILAAVAGAASIKVLKERSRMAALLEPRKGESLATAVKRLSGDARAAAAIPELKSRFEQLITSCPLPILIIDENLIIRYLSVRAEDELDQPRRNRGLLESLESHELENAAQTALETFKPVEVTVRLYSSGRKAYRTKLIPFRSAEEKKECLIFFQDVAAALEFGELRSQFAATVSHELRTPLAGIRILAETLQNPEITAEETQRFVEQLIRETDRLTQLIDEILFLSSLESGITIEGSVELSETVDSVIEKLRSLAEKFDVKITSDIAERLTIPLSDRMASMVLSNLIENSIKYSGRGSNIFVSGSRDGTQVKVVVKDDGIGIDAEHVPHIFERFYRVDKSRSRRLGGTGLGLSIVKHVVESAGGTVSANSREGFGTEIMISLPSPHPT